MALHNLGFRRTRKSAGDILMRVVSVTTLGAMLVAGLTSLADAPQSGFAVAPQPELSTASLSFEGIDPVITGSVNHMFESEAFVGPNRSQKVDRPVKRQEVMDFATQFTQARIRLAALNAGPTDPSLQQSLVGVQIPLQGEEEGPRISVASVDPALLSSSALQAIEDVTPVDPSIPVPLSQSEQFAYARANTPTTEFAANTYSEREQWCLSTGIYFEARGESYRGQVAVAQVIMNRTKHRQYPSTICGVVFQNSTWRNRCQFSFACDGIPERINNQTAWAVAEEITQKVTSGQLYLTEVNTATHYHANYVYPHWAPRLTRLTKIGLHIFYRLKPGQS